jgi:transcriptional regulator with XRE-family HTH domain/Zn-dependent peptidase ImmA (M78 family)
MTTPTIGTRIKALREAKGLKQDDLAHAFGFKDRQTLSAIETGERRVTAEELLRAVELFDVPLDTFTDPFLLLGEGRFSWRQTGVARDDLVRYEQDAGRLVAAFRTLAPLVGHEPQLFRRALGLTRWSRYEDASAAGERFAHEYELGDVPALRLPEVMDQELGILALMVDPIDGVSGAACRLPELDAVLIHRAEVPGRRNFDLAHELFHILTWDAMPPEHIEEALPKNRTRVEQLADNFASAVLIPAPVLERWGDWTGLRGKALVDRLNSAADELQVTSSALRWRLASLARLDNALAREIPEEWLRHNGRERPADVPLPPLFSRTFVEVIARAIDDGRVSARKATGLLGLSMEELAELCEAHGVEAPYAL